ncbi:MAG: hypothetical protein RMK01_09285 [Thermomicrobium sp.]|nr:hypothetical protein [Thermomicrobium sp.]MDW8060253.1 hypothetical protein [Thermomicrobium sp.]
MAQAVEGVAPLPSEIGEWSCEWQETPSALELAFRRKDRRSAAVGEVVAGRIVLARRDQGWAVEVRVWVLEDLAEHQRLRVRRGTASTVEELAELLTEFAVPAELAHQLVQARPETAPAT